MNTFQVSTKKVHHTDCTVCESTGLVNNAEQCPFCLDIAHEPVIPVKSANPGKKENKGRLLPYFAIKFRFERDFKAGDNWALIPVYSWHIAVSKDKRDRLTAR